MITLRGHLVIFDVPIRLMSLQVTKQSDGSELKILHRSVQEFDNVQLVSRRLITDAEQQTLDAGTSGIPVSVIADIAPLREIDASQIPPQYRAVPADWSHRFIFERGATYVVSVIGDHFVDSTVTAK